MNSRKFDLRVEVGGEVLAVGTGIDVENIDRVDLIEMLLGRQRRPGVDHARIEAHAENGGDALLLAFGQVLPLVVAVPRRGLADFPRFFVDGGIEIRRTGIHAGAQHRHVEEGRADIDHDLRVGLADQRLGRLDIQRIQGIGLDLGRDFQTALGLDAVDDGLALADTARGNGDLTEFIIVLSTLMGHNLGHTSGTDDQNVFLQSSSPNRRPSQDRLCR